VTRREWLQKNPPPKAAGSLRELLERLTAENNQRAQVEASKKQWEANLPYWNTAINNARAAGDTPTLNVANAELQKIQGVLAVLDKQLSETAQLPARIADLQAELNRAARCSTHQKDLLRHKNRPDDLFICEVGPHFFIWTKVGKTAQLSPVDLAKSLPGLDEKLEWI
jgi:hypothetical protein